MAELTAYVCEKDEHIYIQTPLKVYDPEATEIEGFAFRQAASAAGVVDLKQTAPNPKILWASGRYVEAEKANSNADYWRADDLAIKALTPTLCPVTVMHDLRSAVGVIAHTALRLPGDDPTVPRPRLDTVLAIWGHRFPDIAEETRINAQQGTLMQSMECISPHWDCSCCGQMMLRTASWQEDWAQHVATHDPMGGELRAPARILGGVVFTGTGLIFGTRGARGAYPEAHLEVEALAELHAKSHHDKAHRPQRRRNRMDLDDAKYQELVAQATLAKTAEAKVSELTATIAAKDSTIETLEAAKVKAESERDAEKAAREAAETKANIAAMREDRLGKFGTAFVAALDKRANTKAKVHDQAGTLPDADWLARVTELEELLDVKADAAADPAGGTEDKGNGGSGAPEGTAGLLFDREVVANAGIAPPAGGAGPQAPSPAARQSVIGGLVRRQTRPQTPAAK